MGSSLLVRLRPKIAKRRLKLLRAVRTTSLRDPAAASLRHRYDAWRVAGMTVSLGILLAVPLSGLARVDVWRGEHRALFRETELAPALAGVIIGIAAMYVVTFLANVLAGRMFCGWGCPVGQISRLGERIDTPKATRTEQILRSIAGGAFGATFVLAMAAWWVDLRVLWLGEGRELAIAWSVVLAGFVGSYLHGRWWRWSFCTRVCPIGAYYTFMAPAKWYGISFPNTHDSCIECNACDHVCPVDLAPRELAAPIPSRGGLSIEGAPGRNHCLECGDCVRACEWMVTPKSLPVPLELGFHGTSARARPRAENTRGDTAVKSAGTGDSGA